MPLNLPNILTWLRIALIPLFVAVFYLPDGWLPKHSLNLIATALFALAAATDWLDGWLARQLDQTSAFGAFLDPVADKLMVAAALIVLVDLDRAGIAASVIIIGREIAISALREWMAKVGRAHSVAVSFFGKVKTTAQMAAILLLLYHDPIGGLDAQWLGRWLLDIAAFLTLWSMLHYLWLAWRELRDRTIDGTHAGAGG
ncbi:MAG: CDP-diacylglycerol--glycerol-3-phosphate 3-phosphatidyltransferase [Thiobacillaceae bacterium]|nr:CDP-diacylglycerol--glycerol-3-phosphate 3-phosphatidyltransferase [Thiobacillaceae bacterium]MCX7674168.1 CDP-diacylglycerol--glycerol-3-phosphate 3-phosphatidyltransferase [Thiobacillaceae bacterium]MDW8322964.1 CDP-diacylglycerol--glycerol-3-phosphate 3-phosphatidyltransferase [Burkholderiales bacterium]